MLCLKDLIKNVTNKFYFSTKISNKFEHFHLAKKKKKKRIEVSNFLNSLTSPIRKIFKLLQKSKTITALKKIINIKKA